jgi:tRNA (guanine37-N1)-methyltransferase
LPADECFEEESHWNGLLEYPHYTRPEIWEGEKVPEVLLSGHHKNIEKWRHEKSLEVTLEVKGSLPSI